MPLAFILGIPWKDCRIVATLIGKKIVLNEFLAYIDLGNLIKEKKIEVSSNIQYPGNDHMVVGFVFNYATIAYHH